jgi:acyl carrier protein
VPFHSPREHMDRQHIETRIEAFVRTNFDVAPDDPRFGWDIDLFESGYVDSVGVVELLAFLSDEFGVDVPDEDVMSDEFPKIHGMARVVEALQRATTVSPEDSGRDQAPENARSFD